MPRCTSRRVMGVLTASGVALTGALTAMPVAQATTSAATRVDTATDTIAQIQGASHRSPLVGRTVDDVKGVVTATDGSGLWMQSLSPDHDPATSEGLYVYGRSSAQVGDVVQVSGTVSEYRPGGQDSANLSTTEITDPTIEVRASGQALPDPVIIGIDRVAPQQTIKADADGSVENPDVPFDPTRNALDFDESLEGMRVGLEDARAVGPTQTSYGETPVVPGQHVNAVRSPSGGVVYTGYDQPNAMRLILDDSLLPEGALQAADVGDTYAGATVGVLDYDYGNYHLMATKAGALQEGGLEPTVAPQASPTQLAVGTFNVENLDAQDPQRKFDRLADQLVHNMAAPDIVAIEEIQDDNGATDDGTVDSTRTTDRFIAAIRAAGGPTYRATWVNPQDKTDGGEPGGNIRQVILYRSGHGLRLVHKPGATATSATTVTGQGRHTSISLSPGRIDPTDPAWDDSRKPLVAEFIWRGAPIFVIANHFASKGGDEPLMGRWQPPQRASEDQRVQQAEVVRDFTDDLLAADPKANIITLGDLNDFEFSQTVDVLVGSGSTAMTDLPRTLPEDERYTYVYEGNSEVLDHILLSQSLSRLERPHGPVGQAYEYQVVHTNAEFSDQDSDHDPQVVRINQAALRR